MEKDYIIDLIPCDTTVNMILAVGWKVGTEQNAKNLPVEAYNCSSSSLNPISYKELYSGFVEMGRKYPYSNVYSYPRIKFYNTDFFSNLAVFTLQKIPAYFVDFTLKLKEKKPKLIKMIDTTYDNYHKVKFATTTRTTFHSENPIKLMKLMSQKDLQEFDFDVRKVNWKSFIETYYLGMRQYLGKEKSDNFPILRKKVQRLKFKNYLATGLTTFGSLFVLYKSYNLISKNKN
ncbi:hypothetical protein PVAND_014447 [Polypedilum vanderplanki]|uniref:Fatty acyl-CoA reductase C-terminal domain-containing protein n=1 Tax=Polypedilum vanderplanki TaxID=319348 RepID=A0A9J6B9N7_POLVA|nr:hypothetical protein PVAND_014447 [Polypedilum vanderplanki]